MRAADTRERVFPLSAGILFGLGLGGFFDAIVGLGDTEHPKPDAAPLHLALTQLGGTPRTALFVGDSGIDAACAQAAGVRLAAHLGGYAAAPDDLRPCTVAFSPPSS